MTWERFIVIVPTIIAIVVLIVVLWPGKPRHRR